MKTPLRALIAAAAGSLALAGPASAQSVTRQLPGVPCSVTSTYTFDLSARAMTYGGGVSCAGGVGQKTLDVVPQVHNVVNGKSLWFNISLAGLYQGPTPVNPLRLGSSRAAAVGHAYRVLAYGQVTLANGKMAWVTACSGSCSGSTTLTITGRNRYSPQPLVSVGVGASPCSVTEQGPVFTVVNGSWVMSYGGELACPGAATNSTLSIDAEVAGSGSASGRYFAIAGSALARTAAGSLALGTARTAYLGHGYRIVVSARVIYRGRTYSATARSKTFAP